MFGLTKAEKVKKSHPIKDAIEDLGVKLKPTSSGKLMGLCPFHDDHNPSLFVDTEKGYWRCFAGCGSGSVIDLMMKAEGSDFKETLCRLDDNGKKVLRKDCPSGPPETKDLRVLQDAVEYYRKRLLESDRAKEYLKQRGIFSPELVERFRIGYSDGTIKRLLNEDTIHSAKKIGILSEFDTEIFSGYLVFPIEDEAGNVVNLYGRLVQGEGKPNHRYLKGANRGVFNWQAIKAHKKIILVESVIDCLSVILMGHQNCVPLYGTQGLTPDHLDMFKKHETEEIILLMDNDEAGKKAAGSILSRLKGLDITVSKIDLPPEAADPNDLLLKRDSERPVEKLLEDRQYLDTPKIGDIDSSGNGHLVLDSNGIKFTARGLRTVSDTSMKILLDARKNGSAHTDRLDLYVSRSRKTFANTLAKTFNIQKAKIDESLNALIKAIEEKKEDKKKEPTTHKITPYQRSQAIAFLKAPDLLSRINDLVGRMGYVGEKANRKLAYLVAVSSKLDNPLSLLIRSNSSAGKSQLMEKVVALMPNEGVFFLSRISPQALYYMGENALVHKLVIVDEKHGAEEAEYSIRNLQSRKKLSMAVVMKDPSTGKSKTVIFEVQGPIAYMDSSTATRDNPENENRCFVVYLDESKEQTERVIKHQNRSKTVEGKMNLRKLKEEMLTAQNAIRVLEPVKVTIPFLNRITFPPEYLRSRRDNLRFLNLIESIAFLYQYQRPRKEDPSLGTYIEATQEDYKTAYDLIKATVGTTYSDIPRTVRSILERIKAAEAEGVSMGKYEFSRRQIRSWLKLSQDQVKRSLRTLVDLEYMKVVSGRNGSRYMYRLTDLTEERAVVESVTAPGELFG